MKQYTVSDDCINCKACVRVATENFKMNNNKKAYVLKQPENKKEEELCEKALGVCPVNAISVQMNSGKTATEVILAKSKIKETLDQYPELKEILISMSPKFKRMQTPFMYETIARFADFNDASKMTGISVCEILHTINKHLGTENKLQESMPECIKDINSKFEDLSRPVSWEENNDRYIYNNDVVEDLVLRISRLAAQENIIIFSVERPDELLKIADGLGLFYNIEKDKEYRISFFNPKQKEQSVPWRKRREQFESLEVRNMTTDPFDIILKKAYQIKEDEGFILIQQFEPLPLINMLTEMGFEYSSEKVHDNEYRIYFYKTPGLLKEDSSDNLKVDVVIQSATPVAYPVIMKLLQSEKIRKNINIKELKVWEETEKHLAWIANGKADISFSALITAAKLAGSDIKIPALFVWDNFVLLSRDKIKGFEDLKGKEIYTPLFEEAPPAKITKYLIKGNGLDPEDYRFKFGTPFGRPEEIYKDFVSGKADTVILREPEASYAIKLMHDRNEKISIISYNDLWNKINPGFGSFPNAGLILKGEFARKNPELAKILAEEIQSAIKWVNQNRKDAAKLSFDLMRQSVDKIELFLDRVNFDYMEGETLVEKVKDYFQILNDNKIVDIKMDQKFLNIFRLD